MDVKIPIKLTKELNIDCYIVPHFKFMWPDVSMDRAWYLKIILGRKLHHEKRYVPDEIIYKFG
jgi:hypothetical protein